MAWTSNALEIERLRAKLKKPAGSLGGMALLLSPSELEALRVRMRTEREADGAALRRSEADFAARLDAFLADPSKKLGAVTLDASLPYHAIPWSLEPGKELDRPLLVPRVVMRVELPEDRENTTVGAHWLSALRGNVHLIEVYSRALVGVDGATFDATGCDVMAVFAEVRSPEQLGNVEIAKRHAAESAETWFAQNAGTPPPDPLEREQWRKRQLLRCPAAWAVSYGNGTDVDGNRFGLGLGKLGRLASAEIVAWKDPIETPTTAVVASQAAMGAQIHTAIESAMGAAELRAELAAMRAELEDLRSRKAGAR